MARLNLGKVSVIFKGEYSSSAVYNKLDVVTYQGSSYECKSDNTVGIVPTNITYWSLVAQKGYTPVKGVDYYTAQDISDMEGDVVTAITPTLNAKQNITDNTLTTTNKTIPSAINEVNSIAKGANQAISYSNYSAMVTAFNNALSTAYNVGQNVMIVTLEVPDLWISSIESSSSTYTYTTDSAFTTALATNGYVQVGYYKLSALETQKVDLTDYYQEPVGGIPETDLSSSVQASLGKADTAVQDVSDKQSITDNTLETTNKTVPSAINEVNTVANNALPASKIQVVTQAEYDALVSGGTVDSTVYYMIEEA